ncbi:MAG: hypothetical protein KDK70_21440 [Myxococcales bacterium]|nr:hypothetical protein [Myxococcales bacterium]
MAELTDLTISTGARFIKHVHSGDTFVFEAKSGHILSVSICSPSISRYYERLGQGATQLGTARTVGEINPPTESHDAAHSLGISYGERHSHWGSRRSSAADGYTILTLLYDVLGGSATLEISSLVQQVP